MTPPRPNGDPTTGELAVSVAHQERRIQKSEEVISETRKSVSNVERMLIVMDDGLKLRFSAIEKRFSIQDKFAIAAVIGIASLIGRQIWELIMRKP